MKKLLALLTACLALTLTACGGDDDDDGGGDSGGATPTEQTDTGSGGGGGAEAPAGDTASVDMKDIQFVPQDITVAAGTTITWTNSDDVAHTVTKTGGPGPEFDSGNVSGGGTYEETFNDPGTIDYVCTIHPGQDGTITVE